MAYTVAFGGGGTSNNGASYTGLGPVRSWCGTSSGNTNLAGSVVTVYNGGYINGSYSNGYSSFYGDGYGRLVRSGGTMYFSRYIGNGGSVYDEGDGGTWSNGGLQGGYYWSTVPTAPGSCTYSKSGLNVTVNITSSSSDGGQTISAYRVQYRTSSNGGSTWGAWGSTQTVSGSSYTYTNLTPALTYQFRTYADNSNGSSAATASTTTFLSAGGRRWDGSAWTPTATAKRWDGSTWQALVTAKRWDGSSWVNLS